MFDTMETGLIYYSNKKKYLVLGILDTMLQQVFKEKNTIDGVLYDVSQNNLVSTDGFVKKFLYYGNYYESKTIKEFVFRILGEKTMYVCDYSTYPSNIEPIQICRLSAAEPLKVVDKLDEKEVKVNLLKGALFNPQLTHIMTTDEVYDNYFKNSYEGIRILEEQKKNLHKYLIQQLKLYSDKYEFAKKAHDFTIAKVEHKGKTYFAWVRFSGDYVFVYDVCDIRASLTYKMRVICTTNTLALFCIETKNVSKL